MAAGLAAWIHFVQQPSAALMGGWVGVVLAAFYLCARAGTELCLRGAALPAPAEGPLTTS